MNNELQAREAVSVLDGYAGSPSPLSDVHSSDTETPGAAGETSSPAATLLVYRDENDILHWRPLAKGARWHSSKSDSLGAVCRQADEVMPERYFIDFVATKD